MWLSCGCRSLMSHAIPLGVFQVLKCDRWYSAVFELALVCAVGELHAKFAWRWCRRRPRMPRRGPVVPLVRSTPVVRGVLLWLARFVPCVRYKVRPAWLLPGENGRKFATHARNAPNWAISGEHGEFYTGHAARGGVRGEFCTGSGSARFLMGECCVASAPSGCPSAGFGPPPIGPMRR